MSKKRIGLVGFGHLGQFLMKNIEQNTSLELAFVWNRSPEILKGKIQSSLILTDLSNFGAKQPDLIVEVAHPCIAEEFGELFLQRADFLIGSPTALANPDVENKLRKAADSHGLYIPSGAFWGGEDIQKMADRNTLKGLKVTMTKHPDSFKLEGNLREKNSQVSNETVVLFEGPVRNLCPLAPNNVNTMAAAAIAGHTLGFDKVIGCLVADPNLTNYHIVEIEVQGPESPTGETFTVNTIRRNPATVGNVTGDATYAAFLSSLINAHGKGPGIHFC